MIVDCAILGGGPAGLNAALVLGRAKRNVMLFDDNRPRNAVTQEAHGFLTRDGIKPHEFRALAHQEISRYPSVNMQPVRVIGLRRVDNAFEITTEKGDQYSAQTGLLDNALLEIIPAMAQTPHYAEERLYCSHDRVVC